ncbi:hypothetical protein H671_1g4286 [Cricetulus griseus]|nr:hypothetical protein H671_1g4286 [Cricetulus griseus]
MTWISAADLEKGILPWVCGALGEEIPKTKLWERKQHITAALRFELPQVHCLKACSPSAGVTLGTVELLGYTASLEEDLYQAQLGVHWKVRRRKPIKLG